MPVSSNVLRILTSSGGKSKFWQILVGNPNLDKFWWEIQLLNAKQCQRSEVRDIKASRSILNILTTTTTIFIHLYFCKWFWFIFQKNRDKDIVPTYFGKSLGMIFFLEEQLYISLVWTSQIFCDMDISSIRYVDLCMYIYLLILYSCVVL